MTMFIGVFLNRQSETKKAILSNPGLSLPDFFRSLHHLTGAFLEDAYACRIIVCIDAFTMIKMRQWRANMNNVFAIANETGGAVPY